MIRISTTLLGLSLTLAMACQQHQTVAVETAKPAAPAITEVRPPQSTSELQAVTARIYKEAVTVDSSRDDNFVIGDFNGDGSQDIVVVVKPGRGMLPELNSEYSNWIREDPLEVFVLSGIAEDDLQGSWEDLSSKATRFLGQVLVRDVEFDPTLRNEIDSGLIDDLLGEFSGT